MAEGKADGVADPRSTGVQETRDAAKWLIATFGAIAAVIVAGLSLTNLGSVEEWSDRFFAAIVGLVLSAIGVIWVIMNAADVLVVAPVTLKDLKKLKDEDKKVVDRTVLGPAGSPACLADEVPRMYEAEQQAYEAYLRSTKNNRDDLASQYQIANKRAQLWSEAAQNTAQAIKFDRVRRAFENLRSTLWLKVLLVLAGVAAIAWGMGGKPSQETTIGTVTATPTDVVVQFSDRARQNTKLAAAFGSDCVASSTGVSAVALKATGTAYVIAVVPSDKCKAGTATVGRHDAVVGLPPTKKS